MRKPCGHGGKKRAAIEAQATLGYTLSLMNRPDSPRPTLRDRIGLILLALATIPGTAGLLYALLAGVGIVYSKAAVSGGSEWPVWLSPFPGLAFIIGCWNSRITHGMGHWQILIAIPSILAIGTVILVGGWLCALRVAWGD